MSADLKSSDGARDIFIAALALPPDARADYLNAACAGNTSLRRSVEELLHEAKDVGDFLEAPAAATPAPRPAPAPLTPTGTAILPAITEKPGDRIGRYKLLQRIGEGGCGVVYMAEQQEPVRRRVALKVIKLGMDTKSVIARFEAERQALALMDHPNIAKVLDGGATEAGRPFFVMELVRGVRITDFCNQSSLSTEERLHLFIQVCGAIQHAHQKGIIHRDIKPSNILVTLHDGVPVPQVIDFGIAKATEQRLTDKTLFTEFTAFIGTPAYMSPEQAEMSGLDIDTRSDIYSLGVLLYELLTGTTPFDAATLLHAGLDECRRTIREDEPARPSNRLATMVAPELTTTAKQRRTESARLIHQLRGDLDWVVMKALEKDRSRRFTTPIELAQDISRYLNNEPVLARPPSNVYRLRKLLHRHRGAFAAAATVTLTLIAGVAISSWQAVRATNAERTAHAAERQEARLRQQAERERERAERERASAHLNEYVANINLAQQSFNAGNLGRALQLLEKHRPRAGEPDLRGFEWRYLWQLCQGDEHLSFPDQDSPIQALACSPNGRWLALGLREKVRVYDVASHALVANLPKGAISLAFLPDGQTLITAGPIGVRAWSTADWTEQRFLPEDGGPISMSADGARLATLLRDSVRILNTKTWAEERRLEQAFGPVAFSRDQQWIVTDSRAGLKVWPLDRAGPERILPASTNLFGRMPRFRANTTLLFSPDSQSVIAARNSLSERGVFVLSAWNLATLKETVIPDDPEHIEHTGSISAMEFSPDGRLLATASADHSIRLWEFTNGVGQRVGTLQGHRSEVWALAFSSDGQSVATGSKEGGIKWWPARAQPKDDAIPGTWQPVAISRDSKTLAAINQKRALVFLNLATREPEQQFPLAKEFGTEHGRPRFGPPGLLLVALSADFHRLVHVLNEGEIESVDMETRESNVLKSPEERIELLALSPDGHTMITGVRGRTLRWWDLRRGTSQLVEGEAHHILFSADGSTVATLEQSETVAFRDPFNGHLRTSCTLDVAMSFLAGAAFSQDGKMFAVVCQDDSIRLLDTATARVLGSFTGHKQGIFSVAFAPDGKTLASASDDSTLKFWNIATLQELATVRRLGGSMREMLFAPDGRILLGARGLASRTGGLRFYRAPTFAETDRPHEKPERAAPLP